MSAPQSKVTAQGQISVPAEIRKQFGIGPGSVLEWHRQGDDLIVRKAGRYTSEDIHHALFSRRPKTRTIEEMEQAIADHIRDQHARR